MAPERSNSQDGGNSLTFEVSQRFFFEAAHTLERELEAESSRRIHGHTYHAELCVTGERDPVSGMVVDLGRFRELVADARHALDHRHLNDVPGVGVPTLENLCLFLWRFIEERGIVPSRVSVRRDAMGDGCTLSRTR